MNKLTINGKSVESFSVVQDVGRGSGSRKIGGSDVTQEGRD